MKVCASNMLMLIMSAYVYHICTGNTWDAGGFWSLLLLLLLLLLLSPISFQLYSMNKESTIEMSDRTHLKRKNVSNDNDHCHDLNVSLFNRITCIYASRKYVVPAETVTLICLLQNDPFNSVSRQDKYAYP